MSILDNLYPTMAQQRSRSSWNDRLTKWESPASDSEEQQIERAADMVRNALSSNAFLTKECITILPQGSYYNNTNISLESDMDLRAVHPFIKIECANGLDVNAVWKILGLSGSGRNFTDITQQMRTEIAGELTKKFDSSGVDTSGNKAIRLIKHPGSRADVDIVPAFRYHWVMKDSSNPRGFIVEEGIAILGRDGSNWTHNFPEQHNRNGINKRGSTKHRFKKKVRMLKTLRDELVDLGQLKSRQIPSFLVECLTYCVEDEYFLVDSDDRYQRALRILYRMRALLNNPEWVASALEINGIKYLFRDTQAWKIDDAKAFVNAACARLEV